MGGEGVWGCGTFLMWAIVGVLADNQLKVNVPSPLRDTWSMGHHSLRSVCVFLCSGPSSGCVHGEVPTTPRCDFVEVKTAWYEFALIMPVKSIAPTVLNMKGYRYRVLFKQNNPSSLSNCYCT